MNPTHLHLLLNHFPIVGTLIGLGVLGYGYLTASDQVKKSALWIWVVMAAIAIPVYLTGEPAEEAVEEIAGVSEAMIHEHEEAAEVAIWLMEALGALSLLILLLAKARPIVAKMLLRGATILSVFAIAGMIRTGYLGGQIRHAEIRKEQSALNQYQGEVEEEHENERE